MTENTDRLRRWCNSQSEAVKRTCNSLADAIDEEVEKGYIALPVDVAGEAWRPDDGDFEDPDGVVHKLLSIEYGVDAGRWFLNGFGDDACFCAGDCRHVVRDGVISALIEFRKECQMALRDFEDGVTSSDQYRATLAGLDEWYAGRIRAEAGGAA